MLTFPQLGGKALIQYPARKTVQPGSSATMLRSGVRHALYDAAARITAWDLQFEGLTKVEAEALAAFFEQTEGRYRNFTFIDPFTNLLGWSVNLSHSAWSKGPSVTVSSGHADPVGGHAAATLSNGSQGQAGIGQTLAAPAGYTYCVSAWLKGAERLQCRFTAGGSMRAVQLSQEWRRYEARMTPSSLPVHFGVELEAGGTVSLYGLQAEAQLSASAYMPSYGPGGLHTGARFDQDNIALEAHGPDDYRTSIRIVSGRQG